MLLNRTKMKVLLLLLLFLSKFSCAQNLVYNGGFEIYKDCPDEISEFEIEKAIGWKNPNKGTADYFNSCSKNKIYLTPDNYIGKSETHAGNAYAGFGYYFKDKHIEYIETHLIKKIEIGKIYCLEFFVKKPTSYRFSFDELSVLFSKEEIKTNNADFFSKEIIANNDFISFKIPAQKKDEWTRVSLIYKPKTEGQFLIIGFNQPESLAKLHIQSKTIGSYYYIDDVSLIEIKDSSKCICNIITEPLKKDSVKIEVTKSLNQYDDAINKTLTLNNIVFETNKSDLLTSSFVELNKLSDYLKEHPQYTIEISGHTDNTGNELDNLKLSKDRAKAVVDYLINKGIANKRLIYNGYGNKNPLVLNDTEEHKKINRRVEFKIISK